MIGVVVLSWIWPQRVDGINEVFENRALNYAKSTVNCVKTREYPIIGVNQNLLTENSLQGNQILALEMARAMGFEELYYVFFLHDRHILGEVVEGGVLDVSNELGFEFIDELPESVKQSSFLFSHEPSVSVFDLLIQHINVDNISEFDSLSFLEDVNKFLKGEYKKKRTVDLNRLRFEMLSPLVALDLLTQTPAQKDTINADYLMGEIVEAISANEEGAQLKEIAIEYFRSKEAAISKLVLPNIKKNDDILKELREILSTTGIEDNQEARETLEKCVNNSNNLKDCLRHNSLRILFPQYKDMISKVKESRQIHHHTLKAFAENLECMINEIQEADL